MQAVGVVLNKLAETLPMAGPSSDLGKAISRAIDALAKVVPPGTVSPAGQQNTINQMALKNQQQMGMMKEMAGGGAPGGAKPAMQGAQGMAA